MATYTAARAKHATLAAATVDTVTLTTDRPQVAIVNRDGTAAIYYTVDGTTPTVGGDDTYVLPAALSYATVAAQGADVIKLISAGTPNYSCMEVPDTGLVLALGGASAGGAAIPTTATAPTAANILDGNVVHTATTGAATLITVPAGRTWVGAVLVTCSASENAAGATRGQALGVISSAGTGVTPAAGAILDVQALAGQNAATGTVGSSGNNHGTIPNLAVVAPVGNAVTLTLTSTITGDAGRVSASAVGALQ